MTPCPKTKPIRLKGKAYQALKKKAWIRAGGCCEECNDPVPLTDPDGCFNVFTCAHLAHIVGRGAGGGDTLDNVKIKCYDCHIGKEHGPQWSRKSHERSAF